MKWSTGTLLLTLSLVIVGLVLPFGSVATPTDWGNWSAGTNLSTARFSVTVSELPVYRGNIYMIGGAISVPPATTRVPDVLIYNVASGSYRSGTDYPDVGVAGSAQVLCGGKIYVFSGVLQSTGWYTDWLRIYDISTDSWSNGTACPYSAEGMFSVLDPTSGLIYVGGGCGMPVTVHDEWYSYNPATDTWTQLADMPMVAANGVIGYYEGDVWIVSGTSVSTVDADDPPWWYSITTDTWTVSEDKIDTKVVLASGGLLWWSGRIYVFGGKTSMSHAYTNKTQVFDIATESWLEGDYDYSFRSLPSSYGYSQGAFVHSMYYLFGGWDGTVQYNTLRKCGYGITIGEVVAIIRVVSPIAVPVIVVGVVALTIFLLRRRKEAKINGKR